ncbi:MAG: hypothetical protein ABL901_07215 [Hyphomicrobiaceae bacterium]
MTDAETPQPLPEEYSWLEGGQNYIACGFYTPNYLPQILSLKASLEAQKINHFLKRYEPRGGWEANTRMKPVFVDYCLNKFKGTDIVYLDADAVVRKPLKAFDNMTSDVTLLFHPTKERGKWYLRISAGTVAVRNTQGGRKFAKLWKDGEARATATTVDEDLVYMAFADMAGVSITVLPPDYYKIFDAPGSDPTIEHFQASRGQFKIRKTVRRTLQKAGWILGALALAYLAYRWTRGA